MSAPLRAVASGGVKLAWRRTAQPARRRTDPALLLPCVLLLAGCASTPAPQGVSFVVVRHAEKATDDARDPVLSAAGTARARALAERLHRERVVAAYATGYRRTQLTAAPTAHMAGITVSIYDASVPAAAFAGQLRATYGDGTVLVVGHSNTVPALAAALCGCAVPAMGDGEYGTVHRIDIGRDGEPRLRTTHE